MFTIDGILWNVESKLTRVAEMTESEISGMMLNRQYFSDVIGTFMSYDVDLIVARNMCDSYSALYEVLTAPINSHTIVVPYKQGVVTINGRITNVKDTYLKGKNNTYWIGISFRMISNAPTKQESLDTIIARGFSPLPDESDVNPGAAYIYTINGWEEIEDADNNYY